MITDESLKAGLIALDIHPQEDLPGDRMTEIIGLTLDEHFDLEFECPTCGKDLPETESCFYCGAFFDGVQEEQETVPKSKRYANYDRVDGKRLLDKLIRFFAVDEIRRGKTVISFWDKHLGAIFKVEFKKYSLKVEFPYRAERIANYKNLQITNYSTPRAGYPSRVHLRQLSDINPQLLEALTSVKAKRAQHKITAPELRNQLEREGLRRAIKSRKKRRRKE